MVSNKHQHKLEENKNKTHLNYIKNPISNRLHSSSARRQGCLQRSSLRVRWEKVNLTQKKISGVSTSFPGSLIFPKRDPGLGWSRVYVYKWNPHRGWIFELILSTLSMEEKVALLSYLESNASCFRDPAWPVFQSYLSKLLLIWLRGKCVYFHYFFK